MSWPLKRTFFVLLQFLIWAAAAVTAAETSQPYCYQNITETSYRTVTKTRIKYVRSRNIFKKMVSKKDTQIEMYEDQEPVYKTRVERICCEGYKMSEYELCEPQCIENGCPMHSQCVEPEVCACSKGYFSARSQHDGKHYCQPLCEAPCPAHSECVGPNQCACKKGYHNKDLQCAPYCFSGCPFGGVCAAPNNCSCAEGYKSWKGTCLITCSAAADQCQNGACVEGDVCQCNEGFEWNGETLKCEAPDIETSTFIVDSSESAELTKAWLEVETDIENANDDIDPNEVFDENIRTTAYFEVTDEYGFTVEPPVHCPADYILFKGKCLPFKFASNDVDCWQNPCADANAVCLENGTCACKEGFLWFSSHYPVSHFPHKQNITCLTPADYEARMQELYLSAAETTTDIQDTFNWTSIFFIVLGVLALSFALVFLTARVLFRQTGKINVEDKNLACAYSKRARSDAEKSLF